MEPNTVQVIDVTLRSLLVASVATAGVMPLATLIGFYLARHRGRLRNAVDVIVMLPLVMPPVAIGLTLLWALSPDGPFGALISDSILLTWQAAAIAAAVVALPLAARAAEQAFEHVPVRLERLAGALGHGRMAIFRRVMWPHAGAGLFAAALLAFARALGEFGATVLVAGIIPGRTETLSLAIYDRINAGDETAAWMFAGVATVIAALALTAAQYCRIRFAGTGRAR